MNVSEETCIVDYFRKQPGIAAVHLFGSVAKGTDRPNSDIDLAVIVDPSRSEIDFLNLRLKFMTELSEILEREPDVVILNEAGPVLCHQVFKYGRLILEGNHKQAVSFKAKSMIEYVDWLPYKARLDKATLNHFKPQGPHG